MQEAVALQCFALLSVAFSSFPVLCSGFQRRMRGACGQKCDANEAKGLGQTHLHHQAGATCIFRERMSVQYILPH